MADYFSPTIVAPDIPISAMTGLERHILGEIFDQEIMDDAIYYCSSCGPSDVLYLDRLEIETLLAADGNVESGAAKLVRKALADDKVVTGTDVGAGSGPSEIMLDLSMIGHEGIFQDIIRRSSDLDHVQIIAAWTCSKMRPDGFGGMATLITADDVQSMSTASFLEEALAREGGDAGPD